MPLDCPFHPNRDVLWWPDKTKGQSEPSSGQGVYDYGQSQLWSCPDCGQSFLCAERLAVHWDEDHQRNFVDIHQDAICLADYCDIMRCNVLLKKRTKETKGSLGPWTAYSSLMAVSSMAATEDGDTLDPGDRCNDTHMSLLKVQCKAVVRQCTRGLLTGDNLSLKDFQDIEDELVLSLCSYLSCDKFNEDTVPKPQTVATSLYLVAAIVIIFGFCLCYYIIWILFETRPSKMKSDAENDLQDRFLQIESVDGDMQPMHRSPHPKPVPVALSNDMSLYKSFSPQLPVQYGGQHRSHSGHYGAHFQQHQQQHIKRPQQLCLQQMHVNSHRRQGDERQLAMTLSSHQQQLQQQQQQAQRYRIEHRTRSSSTARTFPQHPAYYYGQQQVSHYSVPSALQRTFTAPEDHIWDPSDQSEPRSSSLTRRHSRTASRAYTGSIGNVQRDGTPSSTASQVVGSTRSQPVNVQHHPRPPSTHSTPYR
ncbi:hypothetical protein HDE_11729 [Halotydeus destructor]|nr:hypothetical protein HDE_11729 [Halotydeus destructor]